MDSNKRTMYVNTNESWLFLLEKNVVSELKKCLRKVSVDSKNQTYNTQCISYFEYEYLLLFKVKPRITFLQKYYTINNIKKMRNSIINREKAKNIKHFSLFIIVQI